MPRDVELGRKAYYNGNRDAKTIREAQILLSGQDDKNQKKTASSNIYLKSIVYGALDGIVSVFSVMAAAYGADFGVRTTVVLAATTLLTGAISMGMGDFLSGRAEDIFSNKEHDRQVWQMDDYPEGEKKALASILVTKGVTQENADTVVDILAPYKELFVELLMVHELDMMPPRRRSPWKSGLVTFLSFIIFGSAPLWIHIIFFVTKDEQPLLALGLEIAAASLSCFCLGIVAASFIRESKLKTGTLMVISAGLTAAVSYLIGWGIESAIQSETRTTSRANSFF